MREASALPGYTRTNNRGKEQRLTGEHAVEVIIADTLYEFDRSLFGIDEMPEGEIRTHGKEVAERIAERI